MYILQVHIYSSPCHMRRRTHTKKKYSYILKSLKHVYIYCLDSLHKKIMYKILSIDSYVLNVYAYTGHMYT